MSNISISRTAAMCALALRGVITVVIATSLVLIGISVMTTYATCIPLVILTTLADIVVLSWVFTFYYFIEEGFFRK
jgi:hypothetical protein